MALRQQRGNPTANKAAERVGRSLGKVAGRMDSWRKERAALRTDLENVIDTAQQMLKDLEGAKAPARKAGRKASRAVRKAKRGLTKAVETAKRRRAKAAKARRK